VKFKEFKEKHQKHEAVPEISDIEVDVIDAEGGHREKDMYGDVQLVKEEKLKKI